MIDPTADLVRGLGIALALLGAALSAPAGTVLGVRVLRRGARALAHKLRRRRRATVVTVGTASAIASAGSITAHGRRGYPSAGVDERLEWLHERILELEQRVAGGEQALRVEQQDRRQAVAAVETRLGGRLDDLDAQLRDERQRTATWQARGLPVIAASVILTGVPEGMLRSSGRAATASATTRSRTVRLVEHRDARAAPPCRSRGSTSNGVASDRSAWRVGSGFQPDRSSIGTSNSKAITMGSELECRHDAYRPPRGPTGGSGIGTR